MGERRRAIRRRVADVVLCRSAGRVETSKVAHALRDLMVGAGRISTHAEAAHDFVFGIIERDAAAEEYLAADELVLAAACSVRLSKRLGIEAIGVTQTP